ncbi:MAG: hypothetical protein ABFS46_20725, partial [Myxococcota bacterium]
IEEVFQQAELGWLPGASLTDLTLEDEDAIGRPLVLRFSARSSGVGVTQDGTLALRAAPMPLNIGAPFAALPRRTTGLVVPYAPTLEATLHYRLTGARFESVPSSRSIEAEPGSFTSEITGASGDAEVTVHVRSSLRTGVVPPENYEALASYARQVDHAVQDLLRAR